MLSDNIAGMIGGAFFGVIVCKTIYAIVQQKRKVAIEAMFAVLHSDLLTRTGEDKVMTIGGVTSTVKVLPESVAKALTDIEVAVREV